ncbi:hypothetical protein JCGZ_10286 [Jatropha curcas]|uniref:Cupin type-1 domain-containing protein n=1 Tax=Jatropha curcas TaxID=180498 RepID=A0A067LD85_JATCU|nr:hypothetical protein JCGZ_10286 [Jatropha curcas]
MANFLIALAVLAMAASFAIAYDASPLQDFCVATDGSDSGVFVNGKFCKDPEHVTADDFSYSGLNIARETSQQLGVRTNLLTVEQIPGLNTNALSIVRIDFSPRVEEIPGLNINGLSIARIDFPPGGANPPHSHPRAAEVMIVIEGGLYAGFITSNPCHRLFAKENSCSCYSCIELSESRRDDLCDIIAANTVFGAVPSVNPDLLARAFHTDRNIVNDLIKQEWVNPSELSDIIQGNMDFYPHPTC